MAQPFKKRNLGLKFLGLTTSKEAPSVHSLGVLGIMVHLGVIWVQAP